MKFIRSLLVLSLLFVGQLPALPASALTANNGATPKSLFLQVSTASASSITEWATHVCSEHRNPAKDDYIYNIVLTDVGIWGTNSLYTGELNAIAPYLPGGSTPCFDNVFVGPVEPKFADPFGVPTLRDGAKRWEYIINQETIASAFANYFAQNYPNISFHWYFTYEAPIEGLKTYDNTGGFYIWQYYSAMAIEVSNRLNNIRSNRAFMWSPWIGIRYPSASVAQQHKNALIAFFADVKNHTTNGRGIDWLDPQDGIGNTACTTQVRTSDVKKWYNLLKGTSSFASLRVNMEYFSLCNGVYSNATDYASRENFYESNGLPVGASWEMRWWRNAHTDIP